MAAELIRIGLTAPAQQTVERNAWSLSPNHIGITVKDCEQILPVHSSASIKSFKCATPDSNKATFAGLHGLKPHKGCCVVSGRSATRTESRQLEELRVLNRSCDRSRSNSSLVCRVVQVREHWHRKFELDGGSVLAIVEHTKKFEGLVPGPGDDDHVLEIMSAALAPTG